MAMKRPPPGRREESIGSADESKVVGVQFTARQLQLLEQVAADLGITRNEVMREATLRRIANHMNALNPKGREYLDSVASVAADGIHHVFRSRAYAKVNQKADDEITTDEELEQALDDERLLEDTIDRMIKEFSEAAEAGGIEFLNIITEMLRKKSRVRSLRAHFISPADLE